MTQIEQRIAALEKQIRILNSTIEELDGQTKEFVEVTPSSGVSIVRNNSYRVGDSVFLNLVVNITTAKNTGQPIFSFADQTIKPGGTIDIHLIASASYPRMSYIGANSYTLVANGQVPVANWFIQASFVI